MKNLCICSVLVVFLLSSAGSVAAYSILSHAGQDLKWRGDSLTFHVDNTSFPEDSSPWWTGASTAVWNFNNNPSNFRVSITSTTRAVGIGNGRSEIWASSAISAPALTQPVPIVYPIVIPWPPFVVGYVVRMDEADIIVNSSPRRPWTSAALLGGLGEYGDAANHRSLAGTILHEMGHATGLGHENGEYNVMGREWKHLHANGTLGLFYLGEDSVDGLVRLYGLDPENREDLGVVHWKYDSAAGEYSDHTRTVLCDGSDNVLASVGVDYNGDGIDDDLHYLVSPGQEVKVEFTYENNGAHTQDDVRVGFYLSTDSIITTGDRRIGGRRLSLGRADVYTARHPVRLPSSLVTGERYWIGAIVDETDQLHENWGKIGMEWNNATYIPVLVN